MSHYRVHLKRTIVVDEYYLVIALDEDEAMDIAANDDDIRPESTDPTQDTVEVQAVEEIS